MRLALIGNSYNWLLRLHWLTIMDSNLPTDIAAHLARFTTAVLSQYDITIYCDLNSEPKCFDIFQFNADINFRPVDDAGNKGVILNFDDIRIPIIR